MKDIKIPGLIGALIPVIIMIISIDGVQALIDQFTQQTVDAATNAGYDQATVTLIAGLLGVLGSAVIAYLKAASAAQKAASSEAPKTRSLNPAGSEPVAVEPVASPKKAFFNGA